MAGPSSTWGLYLAAENPFNCVERLLGNLGLQVDRDTVQRYAEQFGDQLADQHGVKIADCPVSINFLSFLFGADSVEAFREEYERLSTELVEELHESFPLFWDAEREEFTGPVNTNAIEGGNWRLKYGLRTAYERCTAIRGRTALLALRDSRRVFSNGRPSVTFAHRHSLAGFAQVLGNGTARSAESPAASPTSAA